MLITAFLVAYWYPSIQDKRQRHILGKRKRRYISSALMECRVLSFSFG
jgi:hypothetical protein